MVEVSDSDDDDDANDGDGDGDGDDEVNNSDDNSDDDDDDDDDSDDDSDDDNNGMDHTKRMVGHDIKSIHLDSELSCINLEINPDDITINNLEDIIINQSGKHSETDTLVDPIAVTGTTALVDPIAVTGTTALVDPIAVTGTTALVDPIDVTGTTALVDPVDDLPTVINYDSMKVTNLRKLLKSRSTNTEIGVDKMKKHDVIELLKMSEH
jgi:hypothetical protein